MSRLCWAHCFERCHRSCPPLLTLEAHPGVLATRHEGRWEASFVAVSIASFVSLLCTYCVLNGRARGKKTDVLCRFGGFYVTYSSCPSGYPWRSSHGTMMISY